MWWYCFWWPVQIITPQSYLPPTPHLVASKKGFHCIRRSPDFTAWGRPGGMEEVLKCIFPTSPYLLANGFPCTCRSFLASANPRRKRKCQETKKGIVSSRLPILVDTPIHAPDVPHIPPLFLSSIPFYPQPHSWLTVNSGHFSIFWCTSSLMVLQQPTALCTAKVAF